MFESILFLFSMIINSCFPIHNNGITQILIHNLCIGMFAHKNVTKKKLIIWKKFVFRLRFDIVWYVLVSARNYSSLKCNKLLLVLANRSVGRLVCV